jgi:hypothetical protein
MPFKTKNSPPLFEAKTKVKDSCQLAIVEYKLTIIMTAQSN